MIKVEKLSYGFPQKELYKDVSFTIEDGQHCVLIGSNGTGKTTLVDILLNDEKYLYDGKIIRDVKAVTDIPVSLTVMKKNKIVLSSIFWQKTL